LKRAVSALAFLASLAAFLVFVGGGLFLLAVESSGERLTGGLLAVGGAVAFAAALMLILARQDAFRGAWRVAVIAAGFVATLPVAALSWAALRFAGLPGSGLPPVLEWSIRGVGLVLGLGALALLLLGYLRTVAAGEAAGRAAAAEWREPPRPQPIAWAEAPRIDFDADDEGDEVRVTPVRRVSGGGPRS
jgi:hypothetical protein